MADPKAPNPARSLVLVGLLFLIAGIGGAYMLLLPNLQAKRTDLAAAEAELAGLKQDVQTLETAERNLASAKAELEARNVNFARLSVHYPRTEEVPNIYLQIEEIIQTNPGARNVMYSVGQPVETGTGQARVPVTLTTSGEYSAMKEFLNQLQHNIRPFVLTQVVMAEATHALASDGRTQVTLPPGSYSMNVTGYVASETLSPAYAPAN